MTPSSLLGDDSDEPETRRVMPVRVAQGEGDDAMRIFAKLRWARPARAVAEWMERGRQCRRRRCLSTPDR